MTQDFQLKIVLPSKVLPVETAIQVVLPAAHGMLTVIRDRAPTSILLTNGVLEVLSEGMENPKRYFIQGGVANVADNECVVMTETILDTDEITSETVKNLKEEHLAELNNLREAFPSDTVQPKDKKTAFYDYVLAHC